MGAHTSACTRTCTRLLACERRSRSTAVDVNAVVEAPMSYEPNLRSRTSTVLGE